MTLRLSNWLWIFLLLGASAMLYHTSYRVQELEHQRIKFDLDRSAELENIHVLEAEWTYLTAPMRLQHLTGKYLALQPIKAAQILSRTAIAQKIPTRERGHDDLADLATTGTRASWFARINASSDAR